MCHGGQGVDKGAGGLTHWLHHPFPPAPHAARVAELLICVCVRAHVGAREENRRTRRDKRSHPVTLMKTVAGEEAQLGG